MKRILILINNAPEYRPYFVKLSEELKNRGTEIFFALDSRVTNYLYPEAKISQNYEYFTDYFRDHYNYKLPNIEEYNSDFSKLLFSEMERSFYYGLHKNKNTDYWQALSHNLIGFFEHYITKYKIDAVLYENVSNAFAYAAYMVAKNKGKKYIGVSWSRLPYVDSFEIHTELDVSKEVNVCSDKLNGFRKNWFDEYIKIFQEGYTQPAYMQKNPTAPDSRRLIDYLSVNRFIKLYVYLKYITVCKKEIYYSFQAENPIRLSIGLVKREISRKIKLKFIKKYHVRPNDTEKFFIYPLHYHPESSTSILSPYYINEAEVIRNISLNLPAGYMLYVKEHPNAVGYNELDFYKKVHYLPNVKLMSHTLNVRDFIVKSSGVVTLTSTLGFEALILGKPVILLGDVFYKYFPSVMIMDGWHMLPGLFQKCLNDDMSSDETKKTTAIALKKYFNFLHQGKPFSNDINEVKRVVTAILGGI